MDTNSYEKVGLHFTARDLPKLDTFSHTDGFIVVSIANPGMSFKIVGYTSVVKDTENPDWADQIIVDYIFEQTQVIKLQLYDQDGPDLMNLSKHDFIGEVSFTLSKLMCSPNQKITAKITGT